MTSDEYLCLHSSVTELHWRAPIQLGITTLSLIAQIALPLPVLSPCGGIYDIEAYAVKKVDDVTKLPGAAAQTEWGGGMIVADTEAGEKHLLLPETSLAGEPWTHFWV